MDMTVPRQTQEQTDHIANWQMPPVEIGEMIVWFSQYNNPKSKCAGFVTRVSMRSIECRAAMGEHDMFRYDVLHKDDPRLHVNENMRHNGAWDYSPIAQRLRKVESELLELKSAAIESTEAETMAEISAEEIERRKLVGEKIKASHAKRRQKREQMANARAAKRAKIEAVNELQPVG